MLSFSLCSLCIVGRQELVLQPIGSTLRFAQFCQFLILLQLKSQAYLCFQNSFFYSSLNGLSNSASNLIYSFLQVDRNINSQKLLLLCCSLQSLQFRKDILSFYLFCQYSLKLFLICFLNSVAIVLQQVYKTCSVLSKGRESNSNVI